MTEDQGHQ